MGLSIRKVKNHCFTGINFTVSYLHNNKSVTKTNIECTLKSKIKNVKAAINTTESHTLTCTHIHTHTAEE